MKSKTMTAILCMAMSMTMTSATASAQEKHPGGWGFDIMGITPKPKHTKSSNETGFCAFSGWGFGVNAALSAPEGMNVEMGRSFHFFISDIIGWRERLGKHGSLSLGFGIDLKNFTMTGPIRFEALPTHQVALTPYPEGAAADHSRMRIFSTTLNLKYIHHIGKKFRIAIGPELYVVRAPGKRHEIRNLYTTADGEDIKERSLDIRTNKVGLNIVGMAQYKKFLGLYVKYTPTNYLRSEYGPQFNSISTGFVIFGL